MEVPVDSREERQLSLNHIVTMEFSLLVERKTHWSHLTLLQDQKFTEKREFQLR